MLDNNICVFVKQGGNDHEIYESPRTIGHSVKNPAETIASLKELFLK